MAEGEKRPWEGGDDENGKYPIGFRFAPTTEELVEFYLLPKLRGEPTVPNECVIDAPAYKCDPETLTEKYKERGVDGTSWYFLSPRFRRYPRGDRPVRRTDDDRGRWKPSTGQSKPPEEDASTSHSKPKKPAFSENTLAYYVGSTKDETKTKWLMQELVVPETSDNGLRGSKKSAAASRDDKDKLNRYVACRIYQSPLKKWKEKKAKAEVPTSSPSSGSAPECVGEAAAQAPSSGSQPPAKRTAVERPAVSVHRTGAGAPNKPVSQTISFPDGRVAPTTRGKGGGGGVRMPPVGVGAGAGAGAAGCHGPGLPALVHWPPAYNGMQGPVQTIMRQPPLMNGYSNPAAALTPNANAQAPGQRPPVLRLRPPHRAATTAPNSQGPAMMLPPNLAAGVGRLPSPQKQPPPPLPETEEAYKRRVYAKMAAELKLQKAHLDSVARAAGQQGIGQLSASAQPACSRDDEGANRHASRQQSSSAAPAAAEKAPAAEKMPSKQSAAPGANEESGKGNAAIAENIILQILTGWPL